MVCCSPLTRRSSLVSTAVGLALLFTPGIQAGSAQEIEFTRPSTDPATVPAMPILPQAQISPNPLGSANPFPDIPAMAVPERNPLPPSSIQIPSVTGQMPLYSPNAQPQQAPIPVVPSDPAQAYQRLPENTSGVASLPIRRGELSSGTTLPLSVFRSMTFQPFQAINGNLQVVNPVVDRFGQIVIPAGSVVWGTFEPVYEKITPEQENDGSEVPEKHLLGSRFVANRLTIQSATYLVNGQSELLPLGKDPAADMGDIALRGAGYGAVGGLALGILTGGLAFAPLLAGGIAGAAAGTTNVDQVVSLAPNTIVSVQLSNPLIIQ